MEAKTKLTLYTICVILLCVPILEASDSDDNKYIYFFWGLSDTTQSMTKLCYFHNNEITEIDSFYQSVSENFRIIDNNKYVYYEPGGQFHKYLSSGALIQKDYRYNKSDTILIESSDIHYDYVWNNYNQFYSCYCKGDSINIYRYNGNNFQNIINFPNMDNRYYAFSCEIKLIEESNNLIVFVSSFPKPNLEDRPEITDHYYLSKIDLDDYSYDYILYDDMFFYLDSHVFINDSTLIVSDTDLRLFSFSEEIDRIKTVKDSLSWPQILIDCFDDNYLLASQHYLLDDTLTSYDKNKIELLYYDIKDDYKRTDIVCVNMYDEYTYDEFNNSYLYVVWTDPSQTESALLSYSFDSKKIDTLFTLKGFVLDPQVISK